MSQQLSAARTILFPEMTANVQDGYAELHVLDPEIFNICVKRPGWHGHA